METLPYEILVKILFYLKLDDIVRLCLTSKKFYFICKNDWLWWKLIQRDYDDYAFLFTEEYRLVCPKILYIKLYRDNVINDNNFRNIYINVHFITGEIPKFILFHSGIELRERNYISKYPCSVDGRYNFIIRDNNHNNILYYKYRDQGCLNFTYDIGRYSIDSFQMNTNYILSFMLSRDDKEYDPNFGMNYNYDGCDVNISIESEYESDIETKQVPKNCMAQCNFFGDIIISKSKSLIQHVINKNIFNRRSNNKKTKKKIRVVII